MKSILVKPDITVSSISLKIEFGITNGTAFIPLIYATFGGAGAGNFNMSSSWNSSGDITYSASYSSYKFGLRFSNYSCSTTTGSFDTEMINSLTIGWGYFTSTGTSLGTGGSMGTSNFDLTTAKTSSVIRQSSISIGSCPVTSQSIYLKLTASNSQLAEISLTQ